ncbi:DUF4296 domain-containing protein [Mucilaginibacter glaciei]|uniref:DUF4296 domain-containing protein n=1 Tax=Mucilaginibacter glaciei TaxID=2772109 RepID=A0A926NJ14_9SPHI|nr:DUF4296 domain-containing protein [Mucilaginibacter glaciei]MBD1392136.1 DUF4296 domain-containing protein [Mucilaginibacter glaciei]
MPKYITLFFSVLLIIAGCSNDGPPPGVLPKENMINLLMDIHLVDGQLYAIPQQQDSIYKYGTARYQAVFKQYHTNDANFKKSLNYYAKQPEVIQAMYDAIQVKVKFKIDSLTKVGNKQLKKQNAISQ